MTDQRSVAIPDDYKALAETEANLRNVHDLLSKSDIQGYEATKMHLALAFIKENHDSAVAAMRAHPFTKEMQVQSEDTNASA